MSENYIPGKIPPIEEISGEVDPRFRPEHARRDDVIMWVGGAITFVALLAAAADYKFGGPISQRIDAATNGVTKFFDSQRSLYDTPQVEGFFMAKIQAVKENEKLVEPFIRTQPMSGDFGSLVNPRYYEEFGINIDAPVVGQIVAGGVWDEKGEGQYSNGQDRYGMWLRFKAKDPLGQERTFYTAGKFISGLAAVDNLNAAQK